MKFFLCSLLLLVAASNGEISYEAEVGGLSNIIVTLSDSLIKYRSLCKNIVDVSVDVGGRIIEGQPDNDGTLRGAMSSMREIQNAIDIAATSINAEAEKIVRDITPYIAPGNTAGRQIIDYEVARATVFGLLKTVVSSAGGLSSLKSVASGCLDGTMEAGEMLRKNYGADDKLTLVLDAGKRLKEVLTDGVDKASQNIGQSLKALLSVLSQAGGLEDVLQVISENAANLGQTVVSVVGQVGGAISQTVGQTLANILSIFSPKT